MELFLKNRTILLGVTGSIAAYKAADLASRLTKAGASVDVVLTEAALKFISPLTFSSLTGRKAYTTQDVWGDGEHVLHIALARRADLLLIAPATANTLSALAAGQADTLLTMAALAATCPLVFAPAMDAGMYEHAATQANVDTLVSRGAYLIEPAEGRMASGLIGRGRMVEPEEIVGHVRLVLGRDGDLAGRSVLVTAGGTREPIDPVRAVTNRSSGKQGYALAQAALDRGATVTLITAPTSLTPPIGARVLHVERAAEMQVAVLEEAKSADVLVMAAAVSDFRPASSAEQKIKKNGSSLQIDLKPTEDILKAVAALRKNTGFPAVVVGFAAESQDLLKNARVKLEEKELDLIAANDISRTDAGFAVDTNQVTLLNNKGAEELPLQTKAEAASDILDRVVELLPGSKTDEL
ncbi:MAG: bifunctional phosphopantothenoylcysteine decarboxylase/phosphopantothenate--cysteine ligase CoaBC [Anaerolineales bacterium]|nr:bifunctional phosphopantothenoylcysteine decarboxylase/phosphopantothenate--cysteine ligase CoaBC [Anaerolineales bacterium]